MQRPQSCVVQAFGDQQHGVGPGRRASRTWYGSMMKSLRSTGRSTAARTCAQVVEAALEIRLVGQHAEAAAPCAGRSRRFRPGWKSARMKPARGWPSSPRRSGGSGRAPAKRGEKIAGRRRGGQLPATASRHARLGRRHLPPFVATIWSRIMAGASGTKADGTRCVTASLSLRASSA